MARASRRNNIAAMDTGDGSDDEPVIRRKKSVAPTPAASNGGDSSEEEPVGFKQRKQAAKQAAAIEVDEEDDPPPRPRKSVNGKSKRPVEDDDDAMLSPPSPKSRAKSIKGKSPLLEDDMDADDAADADNPDADDADAGGAGWGWVTSKFFTQDERILERWAGISHPPRTTRNMDELNRFKALCLKNTTKWVRTGIAFEKRAAVWEILSQVRVYGGRLENPLNYYKTLVKQATAISPKLKKDIKADITRTMQEHAKFKTKAAQQELDRILSAYCVRNPAVGYCQSMSHIVGFLMLFYGEESVFWFLCTLIDHYLPADFYAASLLGVRVETQVFAQLVEDKLSKLSKHFRKHEIDLRVVSLKWFMCFFLLTVPMETAARVWDVLLLEGSYVMVNFGLALLEMHKAELLELDETSSILEALNKIGTRMSPADSDTFVRKAMDKFGVTEKAVLKLRGLARPLLEKEYVVQLQNMEKRRATEERDRIRQEAARKKKEREEEVALEQGTEVTKIPRAAFSFLSNFSANSRPKKVTLRLFRIIRPPRAIPVDDGESSRGADGYEQAQEEERKAAESASQVDEWKLTWQGSVKKDENATTLPLNEVQLVLGCTAGVFSTNPRVHAEYAPHDYLCASFLFPPDPSKSRENHSLDVVFESKEKVEEWVRVLKRSNILRIKNTALATEASAAAAAAAHASPSPPAPAALSSSKDKHDTSGASSPKKGSSAAAAASRETSAKKPEEEPEEEEEQRRRAKAERKKARQAAAAAANGDEEDAPPRRRVLKRNEDEEAEFLDLRDL